MKPDVEGQRDASLGKNDDAEKDKDKRKLLEIKSPQNEPTLVPKRKTGLCTCVCTVGPWRFQIQGCQKVFK